MKNNSKKKIHIICLAWMLIGFILLILIRMAGYYDNHSMQDVVTQLVLSYVFSSCIITGIVAYLSRKK